MILGQKSYFFGPTIFEIPQPNRYHNRYNWMILDTVHLLHEAGYDVLPNNKSPLKQGWVRPPNAMDGVPAPLSITVNPHDSIIAKVRN